MIFQCAFLLQFLLLKKQVVFSSLLGNLILIDFSARFCTIKHSYTGCSIRTVQLRAVIQLLQQKKTLSAMKIFEHDRARKRERK